MIWDHSRVLLYRQSHSDFLVANVTFTFSMFCHFLNDFLSKKLLGSNLFYQCTPVEHLAFLVISLPTFFPQKVPSSNLFYQCAALVHLYNKTCQTFTIFWRRMATHFDLTGTDRSSNLLFASSNCTVVLGGVGRGIEGSVVNGWEGTTPPGHCCTIPLSIDPERV